MASMNSRASHIPRLEEDLVQRRHDELKHAQVSTEHNLVLSSPLSAWATVLSLYFPCSIQ